MTGSASQQKSSDRLGARRWASVASAQQYVRFGCRYKGTLARKF